MLPLFLDYSFEIISDLQKICNRSLSQFHFTYLQNSYQHQEINIDTISIMPIIFINWNFPVRKSCSLSSIQFFICILIWNHGYLFYKIVEYYKVIFHYYCCKNCPRIGISSPFNLIPVTFSRGSISFF